MSESEKLTKAIKLLKKVMVNYKVAATLAENEGYETNYDQDEVFVDFLIDDMN